MSKADYPYPEDEFDAPPDPTAPRGVHRAPRSAWSRWWPFLAVLVLAPALAYGIVAFATRGGDLPLSSGGGSDADDTPTATAPATPGGEATDGEEPDGEATEPASEEPTQEETVAPEPDLTTSVTVYNAAGIQGLAAKGAERLGAAGFSQVTPTNFTGTKPAESTVYYATDEDQPAAELVASTLGVPVIQLDPAQAPTGIVVVLVSALP